VKSVSNGTLTIQVKESGVGLPAGTLLSFSINRDTNIEVMDGRTTVPASEIHKYRVAMVSAVLQGRTMVAQNIWLDEPIGPPPPPNVVAAARQYYKRGEFSLAKGDYKESFNWYIKAADLGSADAKERLGRQYALGLGVPVDNAKALSMWAAAANDGDGEAQIERELLLKLLGDNLQAHPLLPRIGGKDSAPARAFASGGNWVSRWKEEQKNLYEQHKYDTDGRGNPRPCATTSWGETKCP